MEKTSPKLTELFDRDTAVERLRQMTLLRRFEEKSAELYSATKIRGFLHLYVGQEAVATGIIPYLNPDDGVVATYREHCHALLKGVSAASIMAEMYGKQEGCSRGRGGSMHLFDAASRFYGGWAIVGGGMPLAAGLALADKMQHTGRINCVFFGEGAMAEGEFHEAMNLASLWQLPVLFVCENNLYAMGTRLDLSEAQTDLSQKAASYNVASRAVDGMDLLQVTEAARQAISHVRSGQGPYFLECRTYRFRAHSMFDAELYREKAEVEQWKQRDPLLSYGQLLQKLGCLDDAALEQLEADVAHEVDEAVRYAEAGSWEAVEDLSRFVYSET
ncbi:MAG: pyruvate dehydrogenase (acetyl-transferring) E1 component subunit alpha [Desulfuromonas sp.]|nr:pyruvate dehydrogenase (acetyl-transferring) E1 component subunit alpha [Desulfuromonas sp.]